MLPALIIFIYLALSYVAINRLSFFKDLGLSPITIFSILVSKVAAGWLYGYIHQVYFGGGDTFLYFKESQQIAYTFFQYPNYYLSTWLGGIAEVPEGADVYIYPPLEIFWRDLGTYVLIHLHALPLLLSLGYYEVHIVFVSWLSLIAGLNFYRIFRRQFQIIPLLLLITCFFMPSVFFWTSGFHKDVWVYLGLSGVFCSLDTYSRMGYFSRTIVRNLLLGLLTILLFRYHLIVLLLPPLIAYFWAEHRNSRIAPIYSFVVVYGGLGLLGLLAEIIGIFPLFDILGQRQQAFLNELGGSQIEGIVPWSGEFWQLLYFLPQAFVNAATRPFFWDCKDFLQFTAALEISSFWLLTLVSFFLPRQSAGSRTLVLFILSYSLSQLLLIGILVGNTGTIVRYRSVAIGLLAVVVTQAYSALRFSFKGGANKDKIISGENKNKSRKKQIQIFP